MAVNLSLWTLLEDWDGVKTRLESPGDVAVECPNRSPGGSKLGGLDVPGNAMACQPGGSGPGSVDAATTTSGRNARKVAEDSGTQAVGPRWVAAIIPVWEPASDTMAGAAGDKAAG